ncbi:ABC transporter permease [Lipingzhangella sp. LS1_29]|uniref:ABC transporter permease n=1 Tax=Lipingzhangella rawalii TaxID=2055835 RepID=A0ABU2HAH5_9ACTN|nr:ABC transporter permease [Lipingzhangella rawalii]MDS1272278.1 ABC transporter permease [Lipingzhangella rawalii]
MSDVDRRNASESAAAGGTARRQLTALGWAELLLFVRAKSNLVNVLFIPALVLVALTVTMNLYDLDALGLALGPVMLATATGIVLVFSLYVPLTGTYVARREELLLKRLRTGEVGDTTILLGSALPAISIVITQMLLIGAIVIPMTNAGPPAAPHYIIIGIVLGCIMMAGFAAATSAAARTSENVQVAIVPLLVLLPSTSGTFFPLEAMPQPVQDVFHWMPMTPIIDLVRAGWTGDVEPAEAMLRIGLLVLWTVIALGAAHRWFRWEPRV